jgi:hypothetical protein
MGYENQDLYSRLGLVTGHSTGEDLSFRDMPARRTISVRDKNS